jgi:malate/lactate dehydrogenase
LQRLASEVVFIDEDEHLAQAEAEDLAHASVYLGCPRIRGTKGR